MIRKYFHKITNSEKDKIKWRSNEVTRIEAFSDSVIAFAVSLLVISLEVPKTSGELIVMMQGFLPFSACFLAISGIWYRQYIFFRRYGMHDKLTIGLNICLIFILLIFVYPLKFFFSAMMLPEIYILKPEHNAPLLIFYIGGFGLISLLFALMYLNAYFKKDELYLTHAEVFETCDSIIFSSIPAFSCFLTSLLIFYQRHSDLRHIGFSMLAFLALMLAVPVVRWKRKALFKKKFGNIPMTEPHHGTEA